MRVVLLAEGGGELRGGSPNLPLPGTLLKQEHWGAGHVLARRCVSRVGGMPDEAVSLIAPLALVRRMRGSSVHDVQNVRRAMVSPDPANAPSLFVLLVDENGEKGRYRRLVEGTQGLLTPRVIGVARREFEAWLIADHGAAATALGSPLSDDWRPGEAAVG